MIASTKGYRVPQTSLGVALADQWVKGQSTFPEPETWQRIGGDTGSSMEMTLRERWESSRPPGTSRKAEKELFTIALRYRDDLWRCMNEIEADVIRLDRKEVDELAAAVTELAEDLHTDGGLWRCLETYHRGLFGAPVPLLCKPGDGVLTTFDARRFQFFFHSVWRHFRPDHIVSPTHRDLVVLAGHASAYFSEACGRLPRHSPTAGFLAGSNRWGWEVKRKLVWLGTRSFLFRFFWQDYMDRQDIEPGEEIAYTDDFLHQQCTAWSGLGALDILAGVLNLPEDDRVILRGWDERHLAVYRIESLDLKGPKLEALEAVNLINDQHYRIRSDEDPRRNPFQAGQVVYGSLVPWRGEWYWCGLQRLLKPSPAELVDLRKRFRESGSIPFRYCPDLEKRAREIEAEHSAAFNRFYGDDLAVFPNGVATETSERKRLGIPMPVGRLQNSTDPVAVFHHAGEGVEMFGLYRPLLSALRKRDEKLTADEEGAIQAFIEEETISPAFVRRVVRETGAAGISKLYFLPEECSYGLDYLLRRFKGCYFRKRYPSLSLRE